MTEEKVSKFGMNPKTLTIIGIILIVVGLGVIIGFGKMLEGFVGVIGILILLIGFDFLLKYILEF